MRFREPMSVLIGLLFAAACESSVALAPLAGGTGASGTLTVVATSPTLSIGDTTHVKAVMTDANGQVVPAAAVTWTSSAPAVATVSNDGGISAVSAGSATVTATSDGQSATAPITVLGTTGPGTTLPPSPSDLRIPLAIRRFDGGSGSVLVSNAIPLKPGLLSASNVKTVRLYVGGVEQPIYVEALEGRHRDSSLRAVLVQSTQTIGAGQVIDAELVIGSARGTADLAKGVVSGVPAAAALPTNPNYLIATGLVGPTLTADSTAIMGAAYRRYDADFAQWADYHWTTSGDAWNDGYYYDRALVYYAAWARTGNPEYWYRAARMAMSYREGYLKVSVGEAPPHWSFVEGLSIHYWTTGDEASRAAVRSLAEYFWRVYGRATDGLSAYDTEGRIAGRGLQAYLFARLLNVGGQGVPGLDIPSWDVLLQTTLPKMLAMQGADGAIRPESYCRESANFSTGIFDDVLIEYSEFYTPDPRIKTFMQKSADFLKTQWDVPGKAFRYISGPCPGAATDPNALAGDLNNLILNTFAWTYKQTGIQEYRDLADQVFEGSLINGYPAGNKQFNQEFTVSYRYLSFRR